MGEENILLGTTHGAHNRECAELNGRVTAAHARRVPFSVILTAKSYLAVSETISRTELFHMHLGILFESVIKISKTWPIKYQKERKVTCLPSSSLDCGESLFLVETAASSLREHNGEPSVCC